MNSKQEENRLYYEKNKEHLKQAARINYWKNRESKLESTRAWRLKNKDRNAATAKRWALENKAIIRKLNYSSLKRQMERNPNLKLRRSWRSRIWRVFNHGSSGAETLSVLGCSASEFREHIYSQLNNGMTKENYADFWELDHIEPCYKFDCTKDEELRACFHYTNYRPLLKSENQWNPRRRSVKSG